MLKGKAPAAAGAFPLSRWSKVPSPGPVLDIRKVEAFQEAAILQGCDRLQHNPNRKARLQPGFLTVLPLLSY